MKKFIAIALFALFATACTPTENSSMMDKGMMCEKCPCCQKMIEVGITKRGMQCPMMQGKSNVSMKCCCCEGMMKNGINSMKSSSAPKTSNNADHKAHHLQQ